MLNIVVLVSGGGTNLEALFHAQEKGAFPDGRISLVISSSPNAYALERARKRGVKTKVISRKEYGESFDSAILDALNEAKADLVVLAGFLSILTETVTKPYAYKIINIHPALIPSFCGMGCYGLHVHEAALRYGVKVTGATVHFVNEVADGGAIILQKAVEVKNGDTPELLQRRVMEEAEWELLPRAVALFCEGKIKLIDGRAQVEE